ncbi:hypothetical protein Tco_0600616 [Tanacetum coccineum]
MLQICPKLPDQQFKELPFEEEILTFLRDLGHSREIKLYGAILHDELKNEAIKDSKSYKDYYAIALGAEPLKIKARVKKKQAGSNTTFKTKTPPTAKGKRLKTSAKEAKPAKKKQPAKMTKAKGLTVLSEKSSDEEDNDKVGMNDDDDNNDDDNDDDDDNADDDKNDNEDKDDDDHDDDVEEDNDDTNEDRRRLYEETQGDVNMNLEGRNTKMTDAPQTNVQDLENELKAKNEHFINTLDENMRQIIKKQVKEQVKEQVSKILPKIEKFVNDQLKAEVLTRSSNQAKTSHAIAANLSKLKLKKILIDKIENNKSIDKSIQQKTLYKALDEDEEPSAGSKRGSKRRRTGKEPESTSIPKEKTSKLTKKSKEGSKSHHTSTGKSAQAEEPINANKDLEEPAHQEFDTGFTEDQLVDVVDETTQHPDWFQKPTKPPTLDRDWNKTLPAKHGPVQPWISTLAPNEDPRESFNELMDTPLDFSTFIMNQLKVDTFTLELLTSLTYELMKEWHNYKHLDWITVRRDDEKLYTFKEGDYNKLRLQDIEDMLLLLVQGKLTNLNVEEHLALGVSLRMFTRSIIRSHTKDTIYNILQSKGFIYQNKDKKNRLMRIDELHKFSDGTLNDVRNALDDILKRIRMEYLPQTVWRNVDKERAGAMIQAIDRQLRNKRLLRSLEKFVGGRLYEGDLQLLERTI